MKYQVSRTPGPNTLQLQSVGHVVGQPASNIKTGDSLMWNFAAVEEVLEIKNETAQFVTVTVKSNSGYVGDRRLKKTRLVCILEK